MAFLSGTTPSNGQQMLKAVARVSARMHIFNQSGIADDVRVCVRVCVCVCVSPCDVGYAACGMRHMKTHYSGKRSKNVRSFGWKILQQAKLLVVSGKWQVASGLLGALEHLPQPQTN